MGITEHRLERPVTKDNDQTSSALSGLIPAGRVGGVVAVRGTVLCPVWSAPLGVKGKGGLAGASVRYI